MKKTVLIPLFLLFLTMFGCSSSKTVEPNALSADYTSRLRIAHNGIAYGARLTGTDEMTVVSPASLSSLKFKKENSGIITNYERLNISEEQTNVPLKDFFVSLSALLNLIGKGEYSKKESSIVYSLNGYEITLDKDSGLPTSLNGNGYTVEFLNE